jgi:thioesterase domain-containing protein/acyl carrier protein
VLVGGEALSPELARTLVAQCGSVWNMYGPTETTIWSSTHRVTGRDHRAVPIGLPIANTSLYILDEQRRPVSPGIEGELYIGGEGLARGYFERDDLTSERFVPDPFVAGSARMYRTGDLARVRSDGNVEFLGRIDHQVKVRGFRIELGEIEAVLEQQESVRHAVVVAREDTPGDKRLVAYVVPQPGSAPTSVELRSHLLRSLPDYMIPSAFVQLGTLPLTPNGKVDRKALPSPKPSDFQAERNYVAPRNATETRLAQLWEDVLGIKPIGVTTSFFDLGGRSLLAARMFMRITQEFGKDLPISTLFRASTIEQVARELSSQTDDNRSSNLISIQRSGSKLPFFCVHGGEGSTLFLHRLARELGTDQPFYGFEAEGLDGRMFQRTSINEMAAHFISGMKSVQPRGPYRIGGYCFGGLVAFEMAQQLRARAETVELVALFSAPLRFHRLQPAAKSRIATQPGPKRVIRLMRSPQAALGWRLAAIDDAVRSRLHMATCHAFQAIGLTVPQSMRTMYVVRMLQRAEERYAPSKYPGKIVLFRGGGLDESADDPNLGWDGLAENIENHQMGASGLRTRRDIMNEPLVGDLAKTLRAYLDRQGEVRSSPSSVDEALVLPQGVSCMAATEPAS